MLKLSGKNYFCKIASKMKAKEQITFFFLYVAPPYCRYLRSILLNYFFFLSSNYLSIINRLFYFLSKNRKKKNQYAFHGEDIQMYVVFEE